MKKWIKWLIIAAIIIALIVGGILYVKNVGIGATFLNVIVGIVGIVLGWFLKGKYDEFEGNCEEIEG